MPDKITLAITGASGAIYGLRLLENLLANQIETALIISQAGQLVLAMEEDIKLPRHNSQIANFFKEYFQLPQAKLTVFGREQWTAAVASGSAKIDSMVVCPCTTGTLAAIAHGMSDNLVERAADVMIKERRQLILVIRETPFSAIHLENMLTLAKLGVVILPANPGFYHKPDSVKDLVDFIVARILDHLNIEHKLMQRWGE